MRDSDKNNTKRDNKRFQIKAILLWPPDGVIMVFVWGSSQVRYIWNFAVKLIKLWKFKCFRASYRQTIFYKKLNMRDIIYESCLWKREKFLILFTTSSFIFTMSRQSDAPLKLRAVTRHYTLIAGRSWMKIAQISQVFNVAVRLNISQKIPLNVTGRIYSKTFEFFSSSVYFNRY